MRLRLQVLDDQGQVAREMSAEEFVPTPASVLVVRLKESATDLERIDITETIRKAMPNQKILFAYGDEEINLRLCSSQEVRP